VAAACATILVDFRETTLGINVNTSHNSLAVFNLGGGEIILILVLLFILAVAAVAFFGLIYLIVRAVLNRPPPAPSTSPQEVVIQNQQKRDCEHLRLLFIFHSVFAGLALLGLAFVFVHCYIMHTVFSNPDMWKGQHNAPPPKAFFDAFIWFYVFMGAMLLIGMVLNVLSAVCLRQKRRRMFSIIVGGLNCLQIPFGTALGIFTILVLSRDSVQELYSANEAHS
jgi:hypothetical protein